MTGMVKMIQIDGAGILVPSAKVPGMVKYAKWQIFEDMKIAGLKALADRRGVEYPKDIKKDDLKELLWPTPTEK